MLSSPANFQTHQQYLPAAPSGIAVKLYIAVTKPPANTAQLAAPTYRKMLPPIPGLPTNSSFTTTQSPQPPPPIQATQRTDPPHYGRRPATGSIGSGGTKTALLMTVPDRLRAFRFYLPRMVATRNDDLTASWRTPSHAHLVKLVRRTPSSTDRRQLDSGRPDHHPAPQ